MYFLNRITNYCQDRIFYFTAPLIGSALYIIDYSPEKSLWRSVAITAYKYLAIPVVLITNLPLGITLIAINKLVGAEEVSPESQIDILELFPDNQASSIPSLAGTGNSNTWDQE